MAEFINANSVYTQFTVTAKVVNTVVPGDVVLRGSNAPVSVLISRDAPGGADTSWLILTSDGAVHTFANASTDTIFILT